MKRLMLVAALLCSACSSLPTKEQLTAFGDASAKGLSTVNAVVASADTLKTRQAELAQASNYMRGSKFAAEQIPARKTPPDVAQDEERQKEQLKIRVSALSDLQAYAKALADAADQGTIDGLTAATAKLATTTGELASTLSVPASPAVAPAVT